MILFITSLAKTSPQLAAFFAFGISVASVMLSFIFTYLLIPYRTSKIKLVSFTSWDLDKLISTFIENWIYLRMDKTGYKNNPSANLRILATLWTASLIFIVSMCIFMFLKYIELPFIIGDSEKSPNNIYLAITVSFFTLWLGLFWKEKKDLHSKWEYLASLYNTVIQSPPYKNNETFSCRESLKVSLVLDALLMGMWAHESFSSLCEEVIINSYMHKTNQTYHASKITLRLKDQNFTDIKEWVGEYQTDIVHQDKLRFYSQTPKPEIY